MRFYTQKPSTVISRSSVAARWNNFFLGCTNASLSHGSFGSAGGRKGIDDGVEATLFGRYFSPGTAVFLISSD